MSKKIHGKYYNLKQFLETVYSLSTLSFKYFLPFICTNINYNLKHTHTYILSLFQSLIKKFCKLCHQRNIWCDIEAACKPSPCGENTQCEVINEVPVCTCLPGYRGSPLAGCRHECESDSECSQHLACSSSFRCESPCKCGENAECQVINHQTKCTCPKVRHSHFYPWAKKEI